MKVAFLTAHFKFKYLQLFKNKENIIVFCRSGARSGNAQIILQQHGFENVVNGGPWQNVQQALDEILQKK